MLNLDFALRTKKVPGFVLGSIKSPTYVFCGSLNEMPLGLSCGGKAYLKLDFMSELGWGTEVPPPVSTPVADLPTTTAYDPRGRS